MPKTKTKVPKDSVKKAKKTPSKKPSSRAKKIPSPISTFSKKPSSTFTKTRLSHFVREILPQNFSQKTLTSSVREDIFTIVIAVIIACIVMAFGFLYAYSRTVPALNIRHLQETRKVQVSSSVKLTPEVLTALGDIFSQTQINSSEVLTHIFSGYGAGLPGDIAESFAESLKGGDMIFQFSHNIVLYRPSEKKVVKVQ